MSAVAQIPPCNKLAAISILYACQQGRIYRGRLVTLLKRAQQGHPFSAYNKCKTTGWTTERRLSSQDAAASQNSPTFNEKTLEHLVCPLSKKDLRHDKEKNELVCDEIGVAYPIINGIPNLVPQDARMLKNTSSPGKSTDS